MTTCPHCADAAALRRAFAEAVEASRPSALPTGCRDEAKALDRMSAAELRALLRQWEKAWAKLYEAVRDATAGLNHDARRVLRKD